MKRRDFLASAAACSLLLPGQAHAAKASGGLFPTQPPRPLPFLAIQDENGLAHSLNLYAGQSMIINLWASWCLPCVAELPALDRLHAAMTGHGVAVLALCLDRAGAARGRTTYDRVGVRHMPLLLDADRKAGEIWSAPVLPTTLLVNGAGQEVGRLVGAAEWDGPSAQPLISALRGNRPLSPDMAPKPARIEGAP